VNPSTINMLFDTVKGIVTAGIVPRSPNYKATYANFIENAQNLYNGTVATVSRVELRNLNIFAMKVIS